MARRFIVRLLAEADLEQAASWYEQERSGLGVRFLADVDQVFGRIRAMPLQFPIIAGNVRRALLHTFPYAVYFRETNQALIVLAVLHLRRRPELWRVRS
jgi:plasmid stabilization system protein ParE